MTLDLMFIAALNVALGLSAAFFHWRAAAIFSRRRSRMRYIHLLAMVVSIMAAVMYAVFLFGIWGEGPIPSGVARPVVTGLIATQAAWGFLTNSLFGDK